MSTAKKVTLNLSLIVIVIFIVLMTFILKYGISAEESSISDPEEVNVVDQEVPNDPTSDSISSGQEDEVIYKMSEEVAVGEFSVTIEGIDITQKVEGEYSSVTTEDQFVVVAFTIKNNDDSPRDISRNQFTLLDDSGKRYGAYESFYDNDVISYETVNPGLSRQKAVIFETPTDVKGLHIRVKSGVLLAGDEYVTVDLEK